jgi:hypothetical protein
MALEDFAEVRRRGKLAERVVAQVLEAGECIGNAPAGKAWVVLHRGNQARPEARRWDWIATHLEAHELETVRGAMSDQPSFILFISTEGFVAVVRQDHTFVTLPPAGQARN